MRTIYLDNNATTRVDPAVAAAMAPFQAETFANPSSVHAAGQAARHAVEIAREEIANFIGAGTDQLVLTANGTDADQFAIAGILRAHPGKRRLVTTAVEHAAVLDVCRNLEKRDYDVHYCGVDSNGRIDLDQFRDALTPETALATVMFANNETGVTYPIREIAAIARERGVPLFVDAIQAAGRLPINVDQLGVDLLSVSAHKIHGSKGAGTLWIRPGVRFECPMTGARSIRNIRRGTENVPAIVGFGAAATLAAARMNEMSGIATLRDQLETRIVDQNPDAVIVGRSSDRIANTTTICFPGIEAEAIVIGLSERGVCVSSGAACSSGSIEPSHVLTAMGLPMEQVRGAIRFSLSCDTTADEIERTVECVNDVITRLWSFVP